MTDRSTVQLVVLVLGLVAIAGMALIGVLAYQAKAVPDALIALSSASLSAVAALLAKTSSEPTNVQVVNQPQDPVPVDGAGR